MEKEAARRALSVATLAVGTEITDGQISDRNSQWLASRLTALGFVVDQLRAVPDDREKIESTLRELVARNAWVFVTGGLGPTSDDFTRECVAEVVSGGQMEWDEPSWQQILDRLSQRGAAATENQKQQCFFPKASQIIKNTRGTANAFSSTVTLNGQDVRVVALPGPPLEIEAVWNESLFQTLDRYIESGRLDGRFKPSRKLKIIRTMGLGEGAMADRVEKLMDQVLAEHSKINAPSSGTVQRPEVGYRAHAPYVEIKLWANDQQIALVDILSEKIKAEFKSYLVNEDDEDVADRFLEKILRAHKASRKIVIADEVSRGMVLQRLFERAQALDRKDYQEALDQSVDLAVGRFQNRAEREISGGTAPECFGLRLGSTELTLDIEMPEEVSTVNLPKLAQSLKSDRGRKWAIEFALLEWGNS